METRLLYIDKLKALAMMLVVWGHTIYFCIWHEQTFTDPLFSLICTFHVPIVTVSLTIIITYCSMAIGIGINRILSLYKRYKSIPHIEQ